MPEKLIAVSTEVAERLERLAEQHSQTIDEYLTSLIEDDEKPPRNWALALVQQWSKEQRPSTEIIDGSETGREAYEDYVYEKWKR